MHGWYLSMSSSDVLTKSAPSVRNMNRADMRTFVIKDVALLLSARPEATFHYRRRVCSAVGIGETFRCASIGTCPRTISKASFACPVSWSTTRSNSELQCTALVKSAVNSISPTDNTQEKLDKDSQYSDNWTVKMLYDGECPLCMREVDMLRKRNGFSRTIAFVDISADNYSPEENAGIDYQMAMGRIHAILRDGSVLTNVAAFKRLYEEVGLGWVYAITSYQPFASIADSFYFLWAKYRLPITGRPPLVELLEARQQRKNKKQDPSLYCSPVGVASLSGFPRGSKPMIANVPLVLTVAGSDSGGGAGIQADIKTCAALGVFCTSAITAITAQNTIGVQCIHGVSREFLDAQLQSVLSDIGADVVKTGLLPTSESIEVLCSVLNCNPVKAVVVDPVMVATSGDQLAGTSILSSLRDNLFPIAHIVTPNLSEASILLGGQQVNNVADMRRAAAEIYQMGPKYVLIKGGHLLESEDVVDVFYDGNEWHEFHSPRIQTQNSHGTGCTLASAVAAELAKGMDMLPAVKAARNYVAKTLQKSVDLRIGHGPQGPLNHMHELNGWDRTQRHFVAESLQLYAVTDLSMNKQWGRSTFEAVQAAIEGGATIVQIRDKHSESADFLKEAEASLKIARKYGVPLLINDRLDIALACNADGVHLGQSDIPVSHARAILGPSKIIGVSCKTPEQAQQAWKDGADYVGSGGVFPTTTKENNKTIGLEGLHIVCAGSPLPVVAIGGISAQNVRDVMQFPRPVNLKGVAVVSGLFNQENVAESASNLKSIICACVQQQGSHVLP